MVTTAAARRTTSHRPQHDESRPGSSRTAPRWSRIGPRCCSRTTSSRTVSSIAGAPSLQRPSRPRAFVPTIASPSCSRTRRLTSSRTSGSCVSERSPFPSTSSSSGPKSRHGSTQSTPVRFVDEPLPSKGDGARPPPPPRSCAAATAILLRFSSRPGRSREPEGAVLTHGGIRAAAAFGASALGFGQDDVTFGVAPFTHVLGPAGPLLRFPDGWGRRGRATLRPCSCARVDDISPASRFSSVCRRCAQRSVRWPATWRCSLLSASHTSEAPRCPAS